MDIVDDDMKEDLERSSLPNSLNSNLSEETFSPEDVAWADSCLTKDMDSPNSDWSSVKAALLEILVSQGPPSSTFTESSGQPIHDEILPFRESVTSPGFGRGSIVDEDLIDDDFAEVKSTQSSEDDEDYFVSKHGRLKGKNRVGYVFRPNYTEDIVAMEKLDSGLDMVSANYDMGLSSEDIFRVWDLGISDEQDDFTKQLNKAISEIPPQTQSTDENSTSWVDSVNMSVDSLIAGIGGLSLIQNTK